MSNNHETFKPIIQKYIEERQSSPVWPVDLGERKRFIRIMPLDIPDLVGIPKNCLPLFLVPLGSGISPEMIGILTDTRILHSRVYHAEYQNRAKDVGLYSSLQDMFTQIVDGANREERNNIFYLRIIFKYRNLVAKLQKRYPLLSPLLIDPPEISHELEEKYNYEVGHFYL